MKKTIRNMWLSALLAAVTVAGSLPLAAQTKGKAAEEQAEQRAEVVKDLAAAADLAAFGRGEINDLTGLKDFKSPEALVAAGGILMRAHFFTGGETTVLDSAVTDGDGKVVAADAKPVPFKVEAEELFDEARELVSKDKAKAAAIEALIAQAMSEKRGAVGKPRMINRTIATGKVHTFKIPFEPNAWALVTMKGTSKTQFEVIGPGGKVLWHGMGNAGFYRWKTGGDDHTRNITVKVINKGGPPVSYTVITN